MEARSMFVAYEFWKGPDLGRFVLHEKGMFACCMPSRAPTHLALHPWVSKEDFSIF